MPSEMLIVPSAFASPRWKTGFCGPPVPITTLSNSICWTKPVAASPGKAQSPNVPMR